VNGRFKEPVGVFVKMLVAALCADLKETSITNSLFESCEDEQMEEDDEEVVEVFSAWAEIRSGDDRRPLGLKSLEKCLATPNVHFRGFATALMALDHIKEAKLGEAETLLSNPDFPLDDANIASSRVLLAVAKNNAIAELEKDEEWAKNVSRGLAGANIIIKRRLLQTLEEKKSGGSSIAGR